MSNDFDWKGRFKARLIARGLDEKTADDVTAAAEIDSTYNPEYAADDELDYMADDARLCGE